jgi:hypothetical protein
MGGIIISLHFDIAPTVGELLDFETPFAEGTSLLETTTIVLSENNDEHFEGFHLNQNFPNPFNPATIIQYTLSTKQFVTLKVFDVLGREIVTLVNGEKDPGQYEVEFSAKGGYPSGVYLYRLKTGNGTATKKMKLNK